MFTLQDDPTSGMSLPGLSVAPIPVDCGGSQCDLRLTMTRTNAGLDGALEYDSDLFDAATIDRMIGHYKTLLTAAVAEPDRPLSDLPMLTDSERQQLLVAWNDTRVDYPRDRCVHELFQEQVARTPDAVAVACRGVTLTYAELNRLSQSTRPSSPSPGRSSGYFSGPLCGTHARHGRGIAGNPKGRRCVCPHRS